MEQPTLTHRNRLIQKGDNPDLTSEREKCTFDTDLMAAELRGGMAKLQRMRELRTEIWKHPELHDSKHTAHMSRIEKIENVSRKVKYMFDHISELGDATDHDDALTLVRILMGIEGFPLALHNLMFVPTIQNQADEEQQDWWLMDAFQGKIIGTYAQTELGHGTNLSHIETTATFDRNSDEFVLHTPRQTAMKWWPGGLGTSCTHVILVANLIINNKNYGPHTFFVPIRDRGTYKALPGIKVGDIGSKQGVNGVDNGYLVFDQVRIPRRNMLMKHSKVSSDGVYTAPLHPKVGYTTMLYMRSEIVYHQSQYLALAMIIAIRYSCVRRQGEITPGGGEVKILDYQTQQFRLFPGLARIFAFLAAADGIQNMTKNCLKDLADGKSEVLADLHALSCGLKSVVTHQAAQSIDQTRQACGGHGFSDASYIPTIFTSSLGACTYEGENIVMLLQLSKYLLKAAEQASNGVVMAPLVEYLVNKDNGERSPTFEHREMLSHYEHVARKRIQSAYNLVKASERSGMDRDYAFQKHAVELCKASRAHTRLYIASAFVERTTHLTDGAVKKVFDLLLDLHLHFELNETAQDLMEGGYMSSGQLAEIRARIYSDFEKIRPIAVSIVDSFDICDGELRSVLGRRDGHVYENLVKFAEGSPLNNQTLPHVEKYLKEMVREEQSKL